MRSRALFHERETQTTSRVFTGGHLHNNIKFLGSEGDEASHSRCFRQMEAKFDDDIRYCVRRMMCV